MSRLGALAVAAVLLSGCGDGDVEQRWARYHQTLEQALNTQPIARDAPANIGKFPPRRERIFTLEETREGLLDVYALRECGIVSLVAERNNQLGRVAPPSQHWLYERTLWQRLHACATGPVADTLAAEDRQRLARLHATKTRQLPYVSWNALFDSEEWEKSFARASQPVDFTQTDIHADLDALGYLTRMVDHQFDPEWPQDSSRLEQALKTLRQRPLTANVLRTLMLATQRLNEATATLNQAPAARCLPAWQPRHLTATQRKAEQWLKAVNALLDGMPVTPPDAVADYRRRWLSLNNPRAPWPAFQAALRQHREARLRFASCSDAQASKHIRQAGVPDKSHAPEKKSPDDA